MKTRKKAPNICQRASRTPAQRDAEALEHYERYLSKVRPRISPPLPQRAYKARGYTRVEICVIRDPHRPEHHMPYYRHKHEQTSVGKQYFNGKSDKAATSVSIGDVLCPALMVCAITYLIIGLCSLPVTLGHLPRARACQLAALALLGATNLIWQLLTSLRHELQLGSSASLIPTRKCFNLQFTTSVPRRSEEEEEIQRTANVKTAHIFEPIFKRFDCIHNALAACFSEVCSSCPDSQVELALDNEHPQLNDTSWEDLADTPGLRLPKRGRHFIVSGIVTLSDGQRSEVRCLVDSAAHANYCSADLAEKLHQTILPSREVITYPDSGQTTTDTAAHTVLELGGLAEQMDCFVTVMHSSYDIVLGSIWFAEHQPSFGHDYGTMTFAHSSKPGHFRCENIAPLHVTDCAGQFYATQGQPDKRNGSDLWPVRFVVNETRAAGGGGSISVTKGDTGILVSASFGPGPRYPVVRMDADGREGTTARRVLDIGVGYPYVVTRDWTATSTSNNQLSVRKSETGSIRGYSPDLEWVRVENVLNRYDGKTSGQIPSSCIRAGTTVKYGDWTVKDKRIVESNDSMNVTLPTDLTNSNTAKVVKTLLARLSNEVGQRTTVDDAYMRLFATDAAQTESTRKIIEGFKRAGILTKMDRLDANGKLTFTLGDVLAGEDPKDSQEGGVYLRMYANFKNNSNCKIYIGSAIQFKDRWAKYKSHPPQATSTHGWAMRNARWQENVILCSIQGAAQQPELCLLAEQVCLLMFGTYVPRMKVNQRNVDQPRSLDKIAEAKARDMYADITAADLDNIDLPDAMSKDVSNEEKNDLRYAQWQHCKDVATTLTSIAEIAFRDTAWTPALRRDSFFDDPQYKGAEGLNIQSPLTSTVSSPLFTKIVLPDREIYRRPKCVVFRATHSASTLQFGAFGIASSGGNRLKFVANVDRIPAQFRPAIGDEVFLTYEIMTDGSRHPNSYARLPKVNRYEDDVLASSLGIRAQVRLKRSGTFVDIWIQNSHDPGRYHDNVPGGIRSMGIAIAMINSLQGKSFRLAPQNSPGARPFDVIIRPSRVVTVSFDPLAQELVFEQANSNTIWKSPGRKRSDDEVKRLLLEEGLQNVGVSADEGKEATRISPGDRRVACDRQYAARWRAVGFSMEHTTTYSQVRLGYCTICSLFDIPCSFTPGMTSEKRPKGLSDLSDLDKKVCATLWYPPIAGHAVSTDMPQLYPAIATHFPIWAQPQEHLNWRQYQQWPQNNGYEGGLPYNRKNASWACKSSRAIISDHIWPIARDFTNECNKSDNDNTKDFALIQKLASKLLALSYDLWDIWKWAKTENLVQAADWIDQCLLSHADDGDSRTTIVWDPSQMLNRP